MCVAHMAGPAGRPYPRNLGPPHGGGRPGRHLDVGSFRPAYGRLHRLAQILRKGRYDRGALRLQTQKLAFTIDKDSGLPVEAHPYVQQDANQYAPSRALMAA